MKKKILITGITGFVGSHLADHLVADKNNKVYGLKRPNSQLRNIHHLKDKIELINGDLIDQSSMINLLKIVEPDEIFHLGAMSWVTPSWSMPAAYMQTNAIGTINLFEAMRFVNCNARVLISCTPEEFGDVPEHMIPITEETRIHPNNPYAASKAAQDMVSMVYHASYGMQIIRTRAFNHEGPRRDILGANASWAYQIAKIEKGLQEPVLSVGNLEATRNFTDVIDLVKAYKLAMEKGVSDELYLIGSQNIYTMKECLLKLISLSTESEKISYKVVDELVRPTELKTFIADFSKFTELTGWKPIISFEDTMQSVLDYWRSFIDKGHY
jgi:GDP-4-dehydro-6-deoxy-D-mannose reductase